MVFTVLPVRSLAVTCVDLTGQVDAEDAGEKRRKRRSHTSRRSQYVVKSVDEITKEDLDNIAYRSKDKIWDKENVSRIRPFSPCSGCLFCDTDRSPVSGLLFHSLCVLLLFFFFPYRAARVTSADRRLWTPRLCVAVVSALGSKVSSVARA